MKVGSSGESGLGDGLQIIAALGRIVPKTNWDTTLQYISNVGKNCWTHAGPT